MYAGLKTYPEDYVDGKLIVNGAKMANDTFKGVGYCLGFLFGWFLERRFVKFNTDVTMMLILASSGAGDQSLLYLSRSTLISYILASAISMYSSRLVIPSSGGSRTQP